MREGEHNLTVAVRVRPINAEEVEAGGSEIVHVLDENLVVLMDPNEDQDDVLRVNRSREKQYVFDYAFAPTATQVDVYNTTSKFLIENVISGFNATVFAYGATGTGKTYTMLGTDREPGIMCLALNDLFSEIEKTSSDMKYKVTMSYLEIYNEMIRDLLNPSTGYLDLREDAKGVAVVTGISEVAAKTTREVMSMLTMGNQERTQEPTAANKTSSRSHAILQVTVKQQSRVRNTLQEVRVGKLFMIDLAGSERAAHTQNRGKRMIEGAHINRSLLALGNCINALCENRGHYVNYRDSKLTRLLKDSLGGNCRTVMIAHSSPDSRFFEETKNTLLYADRAKAIKMKVKRNQFNVQHHIAQYTNIITDLRKEIFRLKAKLSEDDTDAEDDSKYKKPKKTKNRKQMDELRRQLVNTFNEQMEIRQKMMELENTTMDISMDTTRNMMVIEDWEQQKAKMKAMRRITLRRERENCGENDNDSNDRSLSRDNVSIEDSDDIEEIEKKDAGSEKSKSSSHLKFDGDNDGNFNEPEDVTFAREEINNLLAEEKRTLATKSELQEKLFQTRKEAEHLEGILPQKINSEEHREILGLLCKVHELEIHNAELKSAALLRENSLQQKHFMVAKYESRQKLCDEIIQLQRALIDDHSIEYPSELEALYEIYSQMFVDQDEQNSDSMLSRESTALTSSTVSVQKAALLSGINRRLHSSDLKEHNYSFMKLTPLTEESPSRLMSLQNSPVKNSRPTPSMLSSPLKLSRPTPSTQNLFPDNRDGILRSSPFPIPSPPHHRHSHTPSDSSLKSSSPVVEKHEKEAVWHVPDTAQYRQSPMFSRTSRVAELPNRKMYASRITLQGDEGPEKVGSVVSLRRHQGSVTGSTSDSHLVVGQEKNAVRPAHSLSDLTVIEKPTTDVSDDDLIRKVLHPKNNQPKKNKLGYAQQNQRRHRGGSFDDTSRDMFVKPRRTRKEELQDAARIVRQQQEKEKEKQMFTKSRGPLGIEGRGHVPRRKKRTFPKPPPVQPTDYPRQPRAKIHIKQHEPRIAKDGELQSFVSVSTPPSTVHQHNVPFGKGHLVRKKYRTPTDIASIGSLNSMDSGMSTPRNRPRKSQLNNKNASKESVLAISGHAVQPSRNFPGVRK